MNRRTIIEGPGKWDLAMALLEGKVVNFTLEKRPKMKELVDLTIHCSITSLVSEDGSREGWLIGGYVVRGHPYNITEGRSFSCYYDGKRRSGWLKWEE